MVKHTKVGVAILVDLNVSSPLNYLRDFCFVQAQTLRLTVARVNMTLESIVCQIGPGLDSA